MQHYVTGSANNITIKLFYFVAGIYIWQAKNLNETPISLEIECHILQLKQYLGKPHCKIILF